jgi:hypothetical protein
MMTSAGAQDLKRIMDMVESQTGYPVSVSLDPSITTHSAMLSAAEGRAAHLVRLNPKYERYSNALVAQQSAMLLIKWADPNRIPDFRVAPGKVEALKIRLMPEMKKRGYDTSIANKYLEMIVLGLLQQLNSIPCQIMAAEACYELCPNLREEITLSMKSELKETSGVLDPKIKGATPLEIYTRSVAMNAAFAKRWADKSGDRLALLPYEASGFIKKATELCKALDLLPADSPDRYPRAVDSWAKVLDMEAWYEFIYRKG